MKYFFPLVLLLCLFTTSSRAEGTRELAPNASIVVAGNNTTDVAALHINNPSYNFFASYDNPDDQSRLYIHIKDPSKEAIYVGFSAAHNNITSANPPKIQFEYRIKDPNGNVVFGPIVVAPSEANIDTWQEAFNGPSQLVGAGGYVAVQVTSADLASQGFTGAGDYYIEFRDVELDDLLIDFWDITVVDDSGIIETEKKGRVWSYNWSIFAINDFGFPERPFNGAFYVCAPDPDNEHASFVTRIDFNNSGFRPAAFNIAFNSFGAMNTGDVAVDRRSVRGVNATQSEYSIFLNDPVEICETAELGDLELLGIARCDADSYCIKFIASKAGQIEILFDFDGNDNLYTPGTADLMITQPVLPEQVGIPTCIEWDGKDGLGNTISEAPNTQIPVVIAFAQGIYHFPIYDAELMTTGVTVQAVRPAAPNPLLYYDDSNVGAPSGSGEPAVQLAGCSTPCHAWTNYTTPNAIGFGNLCTINTWWFSQLIIREDIFFLPAYLTCDITGPATFCAGGTSSLSLNANIHPFGAEAPEMISTTWSGPGIVGSSSGNTITLDQGGTYTLDMQWLTGLGDTCATSCTYEVSVDPILTASIDTLILLGDEVVINGETYSEGGTYIQHLETAEGCDSTLTILVQIINTIIHYDLDACWSFMSDTSHMDYSEFIPAQPEPLPCADISGSTIHRVQPQKHSCTPGVNNSVAMCISSLNSCEYLAGDTTSLLFTLTVTPDSDTAVQITGIQFYQQAPATYNWISGSSGPNNYPTLYGIRVLKNGTEIWRQEDIPTTSAWDLASFTFDGTGFITDEPATYTFELLPYCLVGNGATVAAWDIDEVSVQASCVSPDALNPFITGTIKSSFGKPVAEGVLQLANNLLFDDHLVGASNDDGDYGFGPIERRQDYFVRASKDGDDIEGVSTLDLLFLQKHLLGIAPFNSAFQYVAADANNSQTVTVLDIVEIKKLILGIYTEFPKTTSWRMHDASIELRVDDPWSLRNVINLEYVLYNLDHLDFTAIKVGDLTGDAINPLQGDITNRDVLQLQLDVEDKMLSAGTETRIDVTSSDVFDISGLQLALAAQDLELIGIEPAALPVGAGDYHVDANGVLRISWISESPISYQPGVVLFRLVVKSKVDGRLSELVSIEAATLKPEAYVNEPLDRADVSLEFNDDVVVAAHQIKLSVTPNPVRESMTISFDMICAETVIMSFFDIAGRLMYQREVDAIIGNNQVNLSTNQIRVGQGMIICQVRTSMGSEVKRVVVTKE
jgi:hypothetical protein